MGCGSSPRVRGKPAVNQTGQREAGLIPARAGKTRRRGRRQPAPPAHPRACGENPFISTVLGYDIGSSPRVRGKRPLQPGHFSVFGLIPARAGKTVRYESKITPPAAHPRACGENPTESEWVMGWGGSSPRVRGKLAVRQSHQDSVGLIPARAGKTVRTVWRRTGSGAHPRACGENVMLVRGSSGIVGSSPRVRGKRRSRWSRGQSARLIPARAGKTWVDTMCIGIYRAHPRACGENGCSHNGVCYPPGSSPRVRGKRRGCGGWCSPTRLIPARAGKTSAR